MSVLEGAKRRRLDDKQARLGIPIDVAYARLHSEWLGMSMAPRACSSRRHELDAIPQVEGGWERVGGGKRVGLLLFASCGAFWGLFWLLVACLGFMIGRWLIVERSSGM
ncbi:hypothetical protein L1987_87751 [Smallanthus sonchifolius]|nr:hypothetical protein L1987_87751 [Smallanthus sonchifolius]